MKKQLKKKFKNKIMDRQLQQIRDQQKESWNRFSSGWRKWDDLFMEFLGPMGNEIITAIHPKDNELILDVAAGTGEPGLTIASRMPDGKVVVTDLAEGMLEVANEMAKRRGIKNIETRVCDVSQLPFKDATFDAVSCRLGFMFFPDMLLAAKEMVRVLKPGGRIATSVWGLPENNFWITAMMDVIKRNMRLPAPPPDAPGVFRCSQTGVVDGLFRNVGLEGVSVKTILSSFNFKNSETYWQVMTDVAAPVAAALSQAGDVMKAQIKNEILMILENKFSNEDVLMAAESRIIFGKKPIV
jgi:ubiquinone/menaquinone biosynthesis C-methylase UbiE